MAIELTPGFCQRLCDALGISNARARSIFVSAEAASPNAINARVTKLVFGKDSVEESSITTRLEDSSTSPDSHSLAVEILDALLGSDRWREYMAVQSFDVNSESNELARFRIEGLLTHRQAESLLKVLGKHTLKPSANDML